MTWHRLYLIAMLPFAIVIGIVLGPLLGLEIVCEKFVEHWYE